SRKSGLPSAFAWMSDSSCSEDRRASSTLRMRTMLSAAPSGGSDRSNPPGRPAHGGWDSEADSANPARPPRPGRVWRGAVVRDKEDGPLDDLAPEPGEPRL